MGLLFDIAILYSAHWLAARTLAVRGMRGLELHLEPVAFQSPLWRRLLVRVAPLLAVFFVAATLSTAASVVRGTPSTQIEVLGGSAAERGGLRSGDRIVAIDGAPMTSFIEVAPALQRHFGTAKPVTVTVERDRERIRLPITLGPGDRLGVRSTGQRARAGASEVLRDGIALPAGVAALAAVGFAEFVLGRSDSESLAGPVALRTGQPAGEPPAASKLTAAAAACAVHLPLLLLLLAAVTAITELRPREPTLGAAAQGSLKQRRRAIDSSTALD